MKLIFKRNHWIKAWMIGSLMDDAIGKMALWMGWIDGWMDVWKNGSP